MDKDTGGESVKNDPKAKRYILSRCPDSPLLSRSTPSDSRLVFLFHIFGQIIFHLFSFRLHRFPFGARSLLRSCCTPPPPLPPLLLLLLQKVLLRRRQKRQEKAEAESQRLRISGPKISAGNQMQEKPQNSVRSHSFVGFLYSREGKG